MRKYMKKYTLVLFVILITAITTQAGIQVAKELNPPKSINNVKICALRVDFPEDDNELTTGKGKFLYTAETHDTLCSKFKIDPVPHNRAYFKDHLTSLGNFYTHASNGNLIVDIANSEVYPINEENTYTVSHKMDYYNPFLEDDSVDIRLAELFVEAVELADNDVNFSDYDLVILFHAGVGQDFAFLPSEPQASGCDSDI
jgi:M6 family metalloprotease-like protein